MGCPSEGISEWALEGGGKGVEEELIFVRFMGAWLVSSEGGGWGEGEGMGWDRRSARVRPGGRARAGSSGEEWDRGCERGE